MIVKVPLFYLIINLIDCEFVDNFYLLNLMQKKNLNKVLIFIGIAVKIYRKKVAYIKQILLRLIL